VVGQLLLEVGELAGALRHGQLPVVHDRDPGRVVAAVLQPPQTVDHDVLRPLGPDVADDPAHGGSLYGFRC
jgi:hypothetical protein